MAKLRKEMTLKGKSESDVQQKFNEWQKQKAGKVSEVEWHIERIEQPHGHLGGSGTLGGVNTHRMIIKYTNEPPARKTRR
jgi:hypothetical protein